VSPPLRIRPAGTAFQLRIKVLVMQGMLIALLAACGHQPAKPAPGHLAIVAVRGPTQPACRSGSRCTTPYRAKVVLRGRHGSRITIRLTRRGRALVTLPPDAYSVTVVSGSRRPLLSVVTINGKGIRPVAGSRFLTRVLAGHVERIRLRFDTGIR
jgi:hypothetical protein